MPGFSAWRLPPRCERHACSRLRSAGLSLAQAIKPRLRPGFIVGPGDPIDRFTFWPLRIDKGGEVLAPGDGTHAVQFIDVRDLSEWIVRLAENADYDIYNGVGPSSTLSMAEMLYGIRAVTSKDVKFTWVPIPFLRENDVKPYSDMSIWIPGDPLSRVDNSRAVASGLSFRPPLAELVPSEFPDQPPVYQRRDTVTGTFTSIAPWLSDEHATIINDSVEVMANF